MADLGPARDNRGQIILVAAFILAVSFVVLAIVVNSAIFTENLSTRDDVAGSQEALAYRAELNAGLESIVESVNENATLGHSDVEASVQNMSTHSGLSQSRLGRIVNVSSESWEGGKRIAQDNASRNFTSNDTVAEDWTLAESVNHTRNFKINITNPDSVAFFEIIANATTGVSDPDQWRMSMETISGEFVLTVQRYDGSLTEEKCRRSNTSSPVTIDVTDATVNGKPCHALYRIQSTGEKLWFASLFGTDKYHIEFENGDDVKGTYSLIVDQSANLQTSNFHGPPNDDYPYTQNADIIWSSTINYAYFTSALAYRTQIEAAPGELPP